MLVWQTWSAFCDVQKNANQDKRKVLKSNLSLSWDENAHNLKKKGNIYQRLIGLLSDREN